MKEVRSFLLTFARFWYRFIIGDDWTLAATVAVGLVVTWALLERGVPAWWLVPALAVVAVGVSIVRTPLAAPARKPDEARDQRKSEKQQPTRSPRPS